MKFQRIFSIIVALTFILGSYQGSIALWRDGETSPEKVFPYSITSLPLADQRALRRGIRIKSEAELMRLIEDYLS